jgi:hypothetical protein
MTAYVSGRHVLSDGPEDWQVWSNMNSGASDVLAGGGDDKITGSDAIERIDGGAGNDRLEGGKNHDVLTGGAGEDLLYADETSSSCNESFPESCVRYGNDVVYAVDGQVDGIDCGAGTDRVEADPDDVVAANCETVVRKGAVGPGPGAGPDPKPGPGTGPGAGPQGGAQLAVVGGKLRAALTKGLSVRLSGMSPGRTRVVASVGARTVGGATVQVGADGAATARIRFTKAARRTLARKRSVTLRVRAGAARTTVKLGR